LSILPSRYLSILVVHLAFVNVFVCVIAVLPFFYSPHHGAAV